MNICLSDDSPDRPLIFHALHRRSDHVFFSLSMRRRFGNGSFYFSNTVRHRYKQSLCGQKVIFVFLILSFPLYKPLELINLRKTMEIVQIFAVTFDKLVELGWRLMETKELRITILKVLIFFIAIYFLCCFGIRISGFFFIATHSRMKRRERNEALFHVLVTP